MKTAASTSLPRPRKKPALITSSMFSLLLSLGILGACSSGTIKEKINKTGDVAGQVVGEFTSGVTSGVEKAIEPKIEISEELSKRSISFGKTLFSRDSTNMDNVLAVYTIYNADFSDTLTAKAYDNKGMEMGRVKVAASGKKNEAGYLEFHFDKRTDLDNDSRITIE